MKRFLSNKNDNSNLQRATNIYNDLIKNNLDVLIDDTDENLSSKIKKFNLLGIPFQIIIGKQTENDLIEFKEAGETSQKIKLSEIIKIVKKRKEEN